jgi:chorismate mutase
MKRRIVVLLLVILPFSSVFASMEAVKTLLGLINQRYWVERDIAAVKFSKNDPIIISIPERIALRSIIRYANKKHELDLGSLQQFLVIEILVAQKVQERWMAHWRLTGGLPAKYKVKDLRRDLIPKLIKSDEATLDEIVNAIPTSNNPKNYQTILKAANKIIVAPFVNEQDKALLVQSLSKVRMKE